MMLNKEAIISCLIDKKICTKEEMEGCSLENVEMREKNASLSLPLQYREFLLGIGRGAGILFQGTDIFFPSIIGLKTDAVNLLKENGENFTLSSVDFVFSMHQGYEFCYFNTSEGDDPPVYQYIEGSGSPMIVWKSFSDFLMDSIDIYSRSRNM